MSPITAQNEQQDSSQTYALSGRIMLTSIITLFVIVFFLVLLHLYARWYLTRLHLRPNPGHRSTRLLYYINNNIPLAPPSTGLDPNLLNTLPLFVYSSKTETKMLECAVCLSEFEEGETGRVLPNCKHRFHTGCIDMWFGSHSTCPLCRSPVESTLSQITFVPETSHVPGILPVPGSSASSTETSFEDRKKRVDVRIDVPVNELATELPSQGLRSPGSRLVSFKRIMRISPSSGVGPSCDDSVVVTESDVESRRQGLDHESSRPGGVG